jgi:hypothetical protein
LHSFPLWFSRHFIMAISFPSLFSYH